MDPLVANRLEIESLPSPAMLRFRGGLLFTSHCISSSLGGCTLVELRVLAAKTGCLRGESENIASDSTTGSASRSSGSESADSSGAAVLAMRGEKTWALCTTRFFSWLKGAKALDHDLSDCGTEDGGGWVGVGAVTLGVEAGAVASRCIGAGDGVGLPTELRKGLPSRLSLSLGDGGSEVTLCSARPARTMGESAGRELLDGSEGLSALLSTTNIGGGGNCGEEASLGGVAEEFCLE